MKSAQKPQDIVILLKVHCLNSMWTYDDLAKSLKTSPSVVYEASRGDNPVKNLS